MVLSPRVYGKPDPVVTRTNEKRAAAGTRSGSRCCFETSRQETRINVSTADIDQLRFCFCGQATVHKIAF